MPENHRIAMEEMDRKDLLVRIKLALRPFWDRGRLTDMLTSDDEEIASFADAMLVLHDVHDFFERQDTRMMVDDVERKKQGIKLGTTHLVPIPPKDDGEAMDFTGATGEAIDR